MSKIKEYIIRKGWHYSNFFPRIFCITDMVKQKGNICFTESCRYDIDEASCVNKLFGFCFGFGVHKNSVRFGWTYNKETENIYVWEYVYMDGKLTKLKSFSCEIGELHDYEITMYNRPDAYYVMLNIDGREESGIRFSKDKKLPKFVTTLGPYFGGNTRAPHDIKIIQQYG